MSGSLCNISINKRVVIVSKSLKCNYYTGIGPEAIGDLNTT